MNLFVRALFALSVLFTLANTYADSRSSEWVIDANSNPVHIRKDSHLGSARFVHGFNKAIYTLPGTTAIGVMRSYLDTNRDLFGHGSEVLSECPILLNAVSPPSNVTFFRCEQKVAGRRVVGAELRASIKGQSELLMIGSRILPHATVLATDLVFTQPKPNGAEEVYFPTSATELRPAYWLEIQAGPNSRVEITDAETGALIETYPLAFNSATPAGTFRVFPSDSPSPFSPGNDDLNGYIPPLGEPSLMVPMVDTSLHPLGWTDGVTTSGNNIVASTNDGHQPLTNPLGNFDFPVDLYSPPENSKDASVTSAFYWGNKFHDLTYELGFTESFGNFQVENFGRGGVGGDPVRFFVQDLSGTNNAYLTTGWFDGSLTEVHMYFWPGPTLANPSLPKIDGAFDIEIVLHELAHGLSFRLAGGLAGVQSLGMAEGWSDFYALSILSEEGDDPHGNYAMGAYATSQYGGTFQDNYFYGLRRFPYSTAVNVNPLTYNDIDPAQVDFAGDFPPNPWTNPSATSVHNMGQVWATALWQARSSFVSNEGQSGNMKMLRLVTEGLKFLPNNPSMVDARDGILLADLALYGGAHQCQLWKDFAIRGLGMDAYSPSSLVSGIQESMATPEALQVFSLSEPPPYFLRGRETSMKFAFSSTCGQQLNIESPTLWISIADGPYQGIPLQVQSGNDTQFEAFFPTFSDVPEVQCGKMVSFYISAESGDQTVYFPSEGPDNPLQRQLFFVETLSGFDDFESDTLWSVGQSDDTAIVGQWSLVDPAEENWGSLFPNEDATEDGSYAFLTGPTNPIQQGSTSLVTPSFDLRSDQHLFLDFKGWYWDAYLMDFDGMKIELSVDQGPWQTLQSIKNFTNGWKNFVLDMGSGSDETPERRIRFKARNALTGNWLISAGIDDVKFKVLTCVPNGAVSNGQNLGMLLGAWGTSNPEFDFNSDGIVDGQDLGTFLGFWN